MSPAPTARPMCYRCMKPAGLCVCATIPRVHNQTGIIVLQHPRERHHPLGTARFVCLGLRRATLLEVGPKDPEALARAARLPPRTALLYPSAKARDIASLGPAERPDHVVVLDGTWHQATTLLRAAPWLRALPHVRLSPASPSAYRIRREPQRDYLSTIEATVATLRALEPQTAGLDALLSAFHSMIDRQIEASAAPNHHHRGERRPIRIPSAFGPGYTRLVVVQGEATTWRDETGPHREILHWCAARPATGAHFEAFIQPVLAPLRAAHLTHARLSSAELRAGLTPDQFRDAWARFCTPNDRIAAWNRAALLPVIPPGTSLLLKGLTRALADARFATPRAFLTWADHPAPPHRAQPRARALLADALAVTEHLHRRWHERRPPPFRRRPHPR